MLECKICGCKFNAIEERHYISRDNGKTGLAVAFGSTNEERKRIYIPNEYCVEEETDDEQS